MRIWFCAFVVALGAALVAANPAMAQSCDVNACPAVKVYGESEAAKCRAWATEAVGQQLENEQRSCGFTSDDWHLDIKLHYRICGGLSDLDRAQFSQARAKKLVACRATPKKQGPQKTPQKSDAKPSRDPARADTASAEPRAAPPGKVPEWDEYCRKSYMVDALKVARTAKDWKCLDADPQLHLSKQRHYDFCVKEAPNGAGDYPLHDLIGERQEKIKQCQSAAAVKKPIDRAVRKRRRACSKFADIFLNAQLENNRLKCAYTGDDWHTNWNKHYRGCADLKLVQRLRLINDRQADLRTCRAKVFPKGQLEADDPNLKPDTSGRNARGGVTEKIRSACTSYAKDAAAHEAANQQLGCGFSGPLWTLKEATHLDACMISRADYASKSNMSRDAKLRQCTAVRLCKDPARAKSLFCQDLTGLVPPGAN